MAPAQDPAPAQSSGHASTRSSAQALTRSSGQAPARSTSQAPARSPTTQSAAQTFSENHPLNNPAAKEEATFYFYISLSLLAIQVAVMLIGIAGLLIALGCIIGYVVYLKNQGERNENQTARQQPRNEGFKSRARVDIFVFVSGIFGMIYLVIFLFIFVRPIAEKVEKETKASGDKDKQKQAEEMLEKEVQESWYAVMVTIYASLCLGQIQSVSNIAFIIMIYNLVNACCI